MANDNVQSEWRVLASSVPGSSHITRGQECQDAHDYRCLADRTLLIAVADGAGSARHAALGSHMAVKSAIAYLSEVMVTDASDSEEGISTYLRNAAVLALESINARCRLGQELSAEDDLIVADFATTLLLVLMREGICGILQIGDGAIVAELPDGTFDVLTAPGSGEYVNETTFLTSDAAVESSHIHVISRHEFRGVAVMTDGIQLLAVDHLDNKAFPPFFSSLFRFARTTDVDDAALSHFLRSERVCDRTDDDKTLVLAAKP